MDSLEITVDLRNDRLICVSIIEWEGMTTLGDQWNPHMGVGDIEVAGCEWPASPTLFHIGAIKWEL